MPDPIVNNQAKSLQDQVDFVKNNGIYLSMQKQKEILANFQPEQRKSVLERLASKGYELEGLNASFDFGEAASNFGPDVLEIGKQIVSTLSHPNDTIVGLSTIAKGALRKATGGAESLPLPTFGPFIPQTGRSEEKITLKQSDEETFNMVKDLLYDQYGSWDNVMNYAEKHPAQFLSDLSIILNPASGYLKSTTEGTKLAKLGSTANRLTRALETTTMAREGAGLLLKPFKGVLRDKFKGIFRLTDTQLSDLSKVVKIHPGDPTDWLIEHGISPTNGLKPMYDKLDEINTLTYKRIDDILAPIPDTYKHLDTKSLLNEIKKFYSKEKTDVVTGTDKIKVLDAKGRPVTQEIPYQVRENIFVPDENLPQETLSTIERIKELDQKAASKGLTLSEIQEVKRLSDDVFSVYNKASEVKGTKLAQKIGGLRKSVRGFIEDQAAKFAPQYGDDLKKIRELNQQSQYAYGWKEITKDTALNGAKRAGVLDAILGAGAFYGILQGDVSQVVGTLGGLTALQISRLPRVRSFIISKLSLMGDGEWKKLLGDINQFSKTQKAGQYLRQFRREAARYVRYGEKAQINERGERFRSR